MTEQHPITPPPELMEQWMQDHPTRYELARYAAQWGADQELELCCEWLSIASNHGLGLSFSKILPEKLRAARRPKPPSLKQQAIAELKQIPIDPEAGVLTSSLEIIRRALEALPDE